MERMSGLLSNFWPWNRNTNESGSEESREERISRVMRPYEALVVRVQSLLIWENPVMSCIFVVGVNLLFWLVITLDFGFYSLASLVMLLIFLYNLWFEQIWPEIRVHPREAPDTEGWAPLHPGVLSVPEISHHVDRLQNFASSLYNSAKNLRQEQPGKFCFAASAAFTILLIIGRSVSGVVLSYISLMAAILLPGVCLHFLPSDTLDRVNGVKEKLLSFKEILFYDEKDTTMTDSDSLVPEVKPEDMSLLNIHAEEERNDEDEEIAKLLPAEEILAVQESYSQVHSLTPSLSAMPAHDEESMDCADLPVDPIDESQDLSSPPENVTGILFRTKHFNRDDSSDDDSFSKGLTFTDTLTPAPVRQVPQEASLGPISELMQRVAAENLTKTLVDAMATVANSVVSSATKPQAKPSSSGADSDDDFGDFEIINEEDLPKFS